MGRQKKKIIFYFFANFFIFINALVGFELNRVILSCNNNPNYIQFWPVVAPLWKEMGLTPTLLLIADKNCKVDTSLGEVIRFDPLKDVPEAMQAQAMRLLAPCLFPDDVCLISDIDMIPVSKTYFIKNAKKCPDASFLVYRTYGPNSRRYPMCYVAAKGRVFSSMFKVTHMDQFPQVLRKWKSLGFGWETDEMIMFLSINSWEKAGNSVMRLNHTVGNRLDREDWNKAINVTDLTGYIDCHCPRPYSQYKDSIDKIVDSIKTLWKGENAKK